MKHLLNIWRRKRRRHFRERSRNEDRSIGVVEYWSLHILEFRLRISDLNEFLVVIFCILYFLGFLCVLCAFAVRNKFEFFLSF
jgi:hypothetical protein